MTFTIPVWAVVALLVPALVIGCVALAIGLWFLWMWATGRLVTWK